MAATGLSEKCSNGLYCVIRSWDLKPENITLGPSLFGPGCVFSRIMVSFGDCRASTLSILPGGFMTLSRVLPLSRVLTSVLLQALVWVLPSSVPSLSNTTHTHPERPLASCWCLVQFHSFSPMCERRFLFFQLPLFLGNSNAWHIPSMCTSEMNQMNKWSSECWEAGAPDSLHLILSAHIQAQDWPACQLCTLQHLLWIQRWVL